MTHTSKTPLRRQPWNVPVYGCLAILIFTIGYNLFDNHRFRLVEEEIIINRLPESFDGFKILQISDLHGRYFGEGQRRLIEFINQLDYDMIALTGDMNANDHKDDAVSHSQALLDLLEGLENKALVFWVDGNVGPYAVDTHNGALTGKIAEIGQILQDQGCQILILPQPITRGNDRIWITPEMSEMLFDAHYRSLFNQTDSGLGSKDLNQLKDFYQISYEQFLAIKDNGEVKILLSHAPYQINLSEAEIAALDNIDYDLILAGHYHGGNSASL